jgi:hypothetical protein
MMNTLLGDDRGRSVQQDVFKPDIEIGGYGERRGEQGGFDWRGSESAFRRAPSGISPKVRLVHVPE